MPMRCAGVLTTEGSSEVAVRTVVDLLSQRFDSEDNQADLVVAFASNHHAEALGRLGAILHDRGLTRHSLGCTGETIVGDGQEVESGPALSVWAAKLPGAELRPIRVDQREDGIEGLKAHRRDEETILLLGDPFSFAPDPWLKKLDTEVPGLRVLGGMASGSQTPRGNRLLLDGQVFEEGGVGLVLGGMVALHPLVSQGCRPIGQPMIVTKAEKNIIRELGRRPALETLREVFEVLPADDQQRVQAGLHIGRVINEYQETFDRGDFLVRNVMGADDQGGIAITDLVRVGQTVQFHVRDAETADRRPAHPDRDRTARPPPGQDRRRPPLQLQRPRDPPLLHPQPRRHRHPRSVRLDPDRRLLRHGRTRPRRRPELRPRLHRQHRPVRVDFGVIWPRRRRGGNADRKRVVSL